MITITEKSFNEKKGRMVGVVEGRTLHTLDFNQESNGIKQQRNAAKDAATNQMILEAEKLGADAIVCIRYSTAPGENGATEVTAYGTAVKY